MRYHSPLCAALAVAVLAMGGCAASARQTAQRTITASAVALVEVDTTAGDRLMEAHHEALAESTTREEYDRRMTPWFRMADALEGFKHTLLAAQRVLDAAARGDSDDVLRAMACVAAAAADLNRALMAVGVPVPSDFGDVLTALGQYASLACGVVE